MSRQNLYDRERFFEHFAALRGDPINFNDCIETPILLAMLPEKLQSAYAPVITGPGGEVEVLVKAADKLSAYIKCVEELKAGNNEFREAAAQTRKALEEYELPEVRYFMDTFMDSFSLTLDELK